MIKREKIIKYAGTALIVGAWVTNVGLVADCLINHTQHICPIASMCIESDNDKLYNIGIEHQKNRMRQSYEFLGYIANVSFNENYQDTVISASEPEKVINDDGTITYGANKGTLVEIGGQVYEVTQNKETCMAFESQKFHHIYVEPIITIDELGNTTYAAPEGYQLEYVDGKLVAAKIVVEEQVLKLIKGE